MGLTRATRPEPGPSPGPSPGPGREIPALDLAALVQRHAAGFGRVRACGDWSDPCFRRITGPLLLAFARHAHLLPDGIDGPSGSLLDAGLAACADAVLDAGTAGTAAARSSGHQDAVVLHALSPWAAAAVARWQVCAPDGRVLVLAARPLSDQMEDWVVPRRQPVLAPSCRIEPCSPAGPIDDRPGIRLLGMVLLLRALPESAMTAACAASPTLLEAALALSMPDAVARLPMNEPSEPSSKKMRESMHALIVDGQWTVNVRRARLWLLDGRLYLAWKTAANELATRLAVDPALLLPALVRQGIVVDGAAGALLDIRTPYTEALPVVELADPAAWLCSVPPALRTG